MILKSSEENHRSLSLYALPSPRELRLGYSIHPGSEIPEGFEISIPRSEWYTAVFLPGNMACRLRPNPYPSRIYVLTHEQLAVFSHSDSHERPFVTKLGELIELNSSKDPHSGSVSFVTGDPSRDFPYRPEQRQCMDCFLLSLRSLWFRPRTIGSHAIAWPLEAPELSLSHRFVLENELDQGESVVAMLVQSEPKQLKSWLLFSRRWQQMSSLTLTDRRLMLVNLIEPPNAHSPTVSVQYTPRECITSVHTDQCSLHSHTIELRIHLSTNQLWSLSIEEERASSLVAFLRELSLR